MTHRWILLDAIKGVKRHQCDNCGCRRITNEGTDYVKYISPSGTVHMRQAPQCLAKREMPAQVMPFYVGKRPG